MKRILSVMLALVLLLGVMPMVAAMADDMITLKVGVYERGNTTNTYGTVTDNYWTRWMQSEFGDPNNIKLEYIPIPRAEDTAKINTMMASGTAPDIIFSYDTNMILGYGRDGGLTDLGDLIEEYGPNIKENLKDALPYGVYMGTQYAIPALRSMIGRYTNFIRKDWLDAKGIELEVNENGYYHMSIEAYEKLVYDAKSWDIDETGMEMYPVGLAGAHNATQSLPLIFAFVDRSQVTEEMVASTPQMMWPGFKDGVRFLNKLYNDKLIDPDFMVDTDTALPSLNAMVSTGRTLSVPQDDMYKEGIVALYETNPEAEFVGLQLDNVHGEQIINVYQPIGMFIAVPATCKNPEAAVKYINFLADLDNYKVLAHGFEGVHYNTVDGEPQVIVYTEEEIKNGEGLERITCGDMNLAYNGSPLGYKNVPSKPTAPYIRVAELHDITRKMSKVGGIADYFFAGIKTEAQEMYEGLITNLDDKHPLAMLISAPADQFDAMYDAEINKWLEQGGQEIIDQKLALYKELEAAKAQ